MENYPRERYAFALIVSIVPIIYFHFDTKGTCSSRKTSINFDSYSRCAAFTYVRFFDFSATQKFLEQRRFSCERAVEFSRGRGRE